MKFVNEKPEREVKVVGGTPRVAPKIDVKSNKTTTGNVEILGTNRNEPTEKKGN